MARWRDSQRTASLASLSATLGTDTTEYLLGPETAALAPTPERLGADKLIVSNRCAIADYFLWVVRNDSVFAASI